MKTANIPLTILAILAILATTVTAYAEPMPENWQYTSEQLGFEPQDYSCTLDTWAQRYAAFYSTIKARGQLAYYEEMLAIFQANPEENWLMAADLNEMRGDILWHAISAYSWVGPQDFPADSNKLLNSLMADKYDPLWLEYPSDLNELVRLGIIARLPESPYPKESWTNEIPAYPIQPGTVYYRAFPTTGSRGLLHREAGRLENYVLFIFDQEQFGYDPEYVADAFPGDEGGLLEAIGVVPNGITYAHGIYQNWKDPTTQSKQTDEDSGA